MWTHNFHSYNKDDSDTRAAWQYKSTAGLEFFSAFQPSQCPIGQSSEPMTLDDPIPSGKSTLSAYDFQCAAGAEAASDRLALDSFFANIVEVATRYFWLPEYA